MMTRFAYSALAVVVSFLTTGTLGFVPTSKSLVQLLLLHLSVQSSTKEIQTPFRDLPPIKDISYGEASRQYRRTVYSHDDWRKHRRSDRFIYYLLSLGVSGVYKNIGREVLATTSIATLVCLYNTLCVSGYTDFEGVQHAALFSSQFLPKIGLPLAPFTLASPSLGLLLGTVSCYMIVYCLFVYQYILTMIVFIMMFSLSHQHVLSTLGRSTQELGHEYQSHA